MLSRLSATVTDRIVFAITNLFNLLMVAIFISRVRGVVHPPGVVMIWVVCILLLTLVVMCHLKWKRSLWEILLPVLFIVFLMLEVVLDYILNLEFRSTWLLGPYLLLYYLSIMGMVGYTFRIGKKYGAITLVTYFLSQIAAIYSYVNVGHG